MSLAENLKSARIEHGLTQKQLATAVDVSRVNLAYYECGVKVPSVAVLTKLADVLNCSIDALLGRTVNTEK